MCVYRKEGRLDCVVYHGGGWWSLVGCGSREFGHNCTNCKEGGGKQARKVWLAFLGGGTFKKPTCLLALCLATQHSGQLHTTDTHLQLVLIVSPTFYRPQRLFLQEPCFEKTSIIRSSVFRQRPRPRPCPSAHTMPRRRDHTSGTASSSRPGTGDDAGFRRPRRGDGRGRATAISRLPTSPRFSASQLMLLLPVLLLLIGAATGAQTTAIRTMTTKRPTGAGAPLPERSTPQPGLSASQNQIPELYPARSSSSSSSSATAASSTPSLPQHLPNINADDDSNLGARGIIANWRHSVPLRPCFGCTPGGPMAFSSMFSECSFVTLGAQMGVAPVFTNLTVRTNDTVLVHLVGSRFFFPEATDLFSFLTNILDGTCPDGNRLQNLTSVCTLGGQTAPVGAEGPALCTIYNVTATKVRPHGRGQGEEEGEDEEGEEEEEEGARAMQARGLYGPGKYRFAYRDFNNVEFPYAFWVLQYLRVEHAAEERTANVTVTGQFNNHPPPVPPSRLFTGMFVVALVVFAVFAAVYNPWVGARAVDLGARVPWLRRNVFEQRHQGPTPQPPPSVLQVRRGTTLMGSGSGRGRSGLGRSGSGGLGGSGRGFHPLRSMVSASEEYQLMMDAEEAEASASSSTNP